jgi:hypothetical protein
MIDSAEEFVTLRTSERQDEYLRAATEPAPIAVWFEVIDRYPEMKRWVAHNKTIPIEILEVLARAPDPDIRMAVAMKNKLTESLFAILAEDQDYSVRQRIVYNKNAPLHIVLKLAENPANHIDPERIRILKEASKV